MKNHTSITEKRNKKKSSGFTLIELIIVISISAILMSIAVPNFTKMIDNNRLVTGTNELVSALILARSEALKRSQNVAVCTSTDMNVCSTAETDFGKGWIVFQDCNDNGTIDSSVDCDNDTTTPEVAETIIKAHAGLKMLEIKMQRSTTTTHATYTFSGRIKEPFTFKVKQIKGTTKTLKKNILVARSGRVKVTAP